MTQRVPCQECGAEILPTTAERTGGVCMACSMGVRSNIESAKEYYAKQRAEEAAYAPSRTHDLVRTKPVLNPDDLAGLTAISLPIVPHQGLGPFLLGTTRARLREVMAEVGLPLESEKPNMDYCCASSLQFEYDATGCVQFIGASYDARINVTWKGRNVFDMSARELFDLINAEEPAPLKFNSAGHRFPAQIVTLWEADEQYDRIGDGTREVWAQVGMGNEVYAAP